MIKYQALPCSKEEASVWPYWLLIESALEHPQHELRIHHLRQLAEMALLESARTTSHIDNLVKFGSEAPGAAASPEIKRVWQKIEQHLPQNMQARRTLCRLLAEQVLCASGDLRRVQDKNSLSAFRLSTPTAG